MVTQNEPSYFDSLNTVQTGGLAGLLETEDPDRGALVGTAGGLVLGGAGLAFPTTPDDLPQWALLGAGVAWFALGHAGARVSEKAHAYAEANRDVARENIAGYDKINSGYDEIRTALGESEILDASYEHFNGFEGARDRSYDTPNYGGHEVNITDAVFLEEESTRISGKRRVKPGEIDLDTDEEILATLDEFNDEADPRYLLEEDGDEYTLVALNYYDTQGPYRNPDAIAVEGIEIEGRMASGLGLETH